MPRWNRKSNKTTNAMSTRQAIMKTLSGITSPSKYPAKMPIPNPAKNLTISIPCFRFQDHLQAVRIQVMPPGNLIQDEAIFPKQSLHGQGLKPGLQTGPEPLFKISLPKQGFLHLSVSESAPAPRQIALCCCECSTS